MKEQLRNKTAAILTLTGWNHAPYLPPHHQLDLLLKTYEVFKRTVP